MLSYLIVYFCINSWYEKNNFYTFIRPYSSILSFGQILNPAKFNYSTVKKGNNQFEIHIKASVDPKWHIYSIYNPDGGAQATALTFSNAKAVGKPKKWEK